MRGRPYRSSNLIAAENHTCVSALGVPRLTETRRDVQHFVRVTALSRSGLIRRLKNSESEERFN